MRRSELVEPAEAPRDERFRPADLLLWVVLLARVASVATVFVLRSRREPEGIWDAWAIWNLRARFLLRAGDNLSAAFSPQLRWSHPDYPLMLPSLVASGFRFVGQPSAVVPQVIAAVFLAAAVFVTAASVGRLRSSVRWGLLAAIVLLGADSFVQTSIGQVADVPTGVFVLLAAALVGLAAELPSADARAALVLAGLSASMAAWTKNDGMLHLLSLLLVVVLLGRKHQRGRDALAMLVGAMPLLLMLAHFKWRYAPPNDLVAGSTPGGMGARLADFSRYRTIAVMSWQMILGNWRDWSGLPIALPIAFMIGLLRRRNREDNRAALRVGAAAALSTAGLFTVYLLTPNDLAWQLDTSLDRVFTQLWPLWVLAAVLSLAGAAPQAQSRAESADL